MSVLLPFAPHTLIMIEPEHISSDDQIDRIGLWLRGVEVIYNPGEWWVQYGTGLWLASSDLGGSIDGYEVLAEPRADTAAALLDEIRPWIWGPNVKNNDYWNTELGKLAAKYGVDA